MRFLSNKVLAAVCLAAALALLAVAGVAGLRVAFLPMALLALAAIVFGVRARLGRHPTVADTERFLVDQFVAKGFGGAFKLTSVKSRVERLFGRHQFAVHFSATVTMTEPLYQPVQLTQEMTGRFTARRISALCAIARRISSELGPQATGIGNRIPPDPFEHEYVVAASAQGLEFVIQGDARVSWGRRGWHYVLRGMSAEFSRLVKTGLPRARHGRAVVLDSTDGKVWFHDTMRAWDQFESEIGELQRIAEQTRTERAQAATERFFCTIKGGALFHGMAQTLTGHVPPTPCFLEFTVLDAASSSASFLLRNDSGWTRARAFTGVVSGDPEGDAAILLAHTRAVDAVRESGPLLDATTDFDMEVRWIADPGDSVVCTSGDFLLKLTAVSPAAIALKRAEVFPREAQVRAALAAGASYAGTVRSEEEVENISVAFESHDESGRIVASMNGRGWTARFLAELAANRYAHEPCDVLLVPLRDESTPPGEVPAPVDTWESLRLTVQGGDLEGVVEMPGQRPAVKLRRNRVA